MPKDSQPPTSDSEDRLDFIRPEPSFRELIMVKKSSNMGNSAKNQLTRDFSMMWQDGTYSLNKDTEGSGRNINDVRQNPNARRYKTQLEKFDKISQTREKSYYDAILKDYTTEHLDEDSTLVAIEFPLPHASKGQFLGYWTAFSVFSYSKIFGHLDEWKTRDKKLGTMNISESLKNIYTNYEKMNILRFSTKGAEKTGKAPNQHMTTIKNQLDPVLEERQVKAESGRGKASLSNLDRFEKDISSKVRTNSVDNATDKSVKSAKQAVFTREKIEFRKEMMTEPKDFSTAKRQLFHDWGLKESALYKRAGHAAIVGFILTSGFTVAGALISKIARECWGNNIKEIYNYNEYDTKVRNLYGTETVENQRKQLASEQLHAGMRFESWRDGISNEEAKSNASGFEVILAPEKQGGMRQKDLDYLMWKMSTGQVQVGRVLREQQQMNQPKMEPHKNEVQQETNLDK